MAHRVLTAALAVASMTFVMGGAPVDDYDGPARWESPTVTISADLEDAAAAWGDTVTFKIDDDDPQISTYRTSLEDGVAGEAQATYRDGHYLDSCRIAVDGGETPAILSHELGHCLGLTHATIGASNMHWWYQDYEGGWSDTVTDSDKARLADLYK